MRFEFATATRILFGPGTLAEVAPAAKALGKRALLVVGRDVERAEPLRERLGAHGVATVVRSVGGEPTVPLVRAEVERAREAGCDLVVGFGGGSVLDAGKAIAALLANGGDPLDYLEVVGKGQALARPSVPFIAVPTTAGTGSEVTRNAVLVAPDQRVKASLRSNTMYPCLAVVDPELTHTLPPADHGVHRSGCLDAAHRAVRVHRRESADGRPLPRGDGAGRTLAPPGVRGRAERGCPGRHGAGKPLRRLGPGQRQAGCRARLRRRRWVDGFPPRTGRSARGSSPS